jgi:hypothetical protein
VGASTWRFAAGPFEDGPFDAIVASDLLNTSTSRLR